MCFKRMKYLKRNSNFELLRIISMLFIILYHFVLYGGLDSPATFSRINFFSSCFYSGGKLGVVLFIMITGYFMIQSKPNVKKVILLEGQVLFYSISIFVVFLLMGKVVSANDMVKAIFPNITDMYWFFSSYFVLYLFSPYINKFLLGLRKEEFQKVLGLGFLFLILIPSLVIYKRGITEGIYLLYYYLIGAYIRLFYRRNISKKCYLGGFIFSYLIMVLVSSYIQYLSLSNEALVEYVYSFSGIRSVLVFSCAICLFLYFRDLKIPNSFMINLLGSLSFGVYLFHEHFLMRDILWKEVFRLDHFIGHPCFFFIGIGIAILIYFSGGILELFRKFIFSSVFFGIRNLREKK